MHFQPLPDWIVIQRDRLLEKFPNDRFDIIQRGSGEFRIQCYDCPEKSYSLGSGTPESFEIHLNNRCEGISNYLSMSWRIVDFGRTAVAHSFRWIDIGSTGSLWSSE